MKSWIPVSSTGMTRESTGMTRGGIGMTRESTGMTPLCLRQKLLTHCLRGQMFIQLCACYLHGTLACNFFFFTTEGFFHISLVMQYVLFFDGQFTINLFYIIISNILYFLLSAVKIIF